MYVSLHLTLNTFTLVSELLLELDRMINWMLPTFAEYLTTAQTR